LLGIGFFDDQNGAVVLHLRDSSISFPQSVFNNNHHETEITVLSSLTEKAGPMLCDRFTLYRAF
jgi:hypothetical protein